jgi:hypothetical protein
MDHDAKPLGKAPGQWEGSRIAWPAGSDSVLENRILPPVRASFHSRGNFKSDRLKGLKGQQGLHQDTLLSRPGLSLALPASQCLFCNQSLPWPPPAPTVVARRRTLESRGRRREKQRVGGDIRGQAPPRNKPGPHRSLCPGDKLTKISRNILNYISSEWLNSLDNHLALAEGFGPDPKACAAQKRAWFDSRLRTYEKASSARCSLHLPRLL